MRYKYPLKDNQDATIRITNGTDDNGKPLVVGTSNVKCTILYESRSKADKDGKMVQLKGTLFKKGDIFPDFPIIQGYVDVKGEEYVIYFGARIKDPDGKTHHIEMELM